MFMILLFLFSLYFWTTALFHIASTFDPLGFALIFEEVVMNVIQLFKKCIWEREGVVAALQETQTEKIGPVDQFVILCLFATDIFILILRKWTWIVYIFLESVYIIYK